MHEDLQVSSFTVFTENNLFVEKYKLFLKSTIYSYVITDILKVVARKYYET